MAEGNSIEVFTEDIWGFNLDSPAPLPAGPKPCQLVPPCREGNHGVQPLVDTAYKKIGKYYFTEEALKHDLGALKRGKVYTKQEFYRRARAWYKADIDRILHWHRVYKERNPEHPKEFVDPKTKSEANDDTNEKSEEIVKETQIGGDGKEKNKEVDDKAPPIVAEPNIQDSKPKSKPRAKKVKVPAAPTRIQPAREAKRKVVEPPIRQSKKKAKIEETIEAAPPTPEPEPVAPLDVKGEGFVEQTEQSPGRAGLQPNGSQERPKPQEQSELPKSEEEPPQDEPPEETKGDYQLNLDEWKIFLARYNSATTPVTPTPSPTSLSAFTLTQLQGLDIANFVLRLERIVEAKINHLIDERQGITIDAGAGGGLCLTGYYHHPYKCALDGNYVPPLKFEAAGGYVPGEDWRPEKLEVEKQEETVGGEVADSAADESDKGPPEDMIERTVGVVSSPRYRPPGTGRRLAERGLSSANTSRAVSPFPTRQEAGSALAPIPGLEAALHEQAQAATAGNSDSNKGLEAAGNTDRNASVQSPRPIQTLPKLTGLPTLPSGEENNVSRPTSMRNSPAPEAFMDISPTLGRWQPPIPGLPLEDFDDAIIDVAGLRFAVDLCAGYLGDGRSARMFML